MRTILVLLSLWGTVSFAAVRRWRHAHFVSRQDDQLRALLAGKVPLPLPVPRSAPDALPSAQQSAV